MLQNLLFSGVVLDTATTLFGGAVGDGESLRFSASLECTLGVSEILSSLSSFFSSLAELEFYKFYITLYHQ